jgi:hypothetical protein
MQKTAAQQAYRRFVKRAQGEYEGQGWSDNLSEDQIRQLMEEAEMADRANSSGPPLGRLIDPDAFMDPNTTSPLERKRGTQGAGAAVGMGAGLLGGALTGAIAPKRTISKILGGIGGGIGGAALGSLGGWGVGSLLAKSRMGSEYPQG